ncbi:hypothetical protein NM897_17190 (plasmid) [Planococcus maritimus]|uniref:hypothetical protein n=1 Tax=Planococcus maritimus TaxID=192421 RepID=UPI0031398C4D
MRQAEFERFLIESEAIKSKKKAVVSRIAKALKVERELKVNLDNIVSDDDKTYELLLRIREDMNEVNGVYQNSIRKYYLFINGKEFPRLNNYKKWNYSS